MIINRIPKRRNARYESDPSDSIYCSVFDRNEPCNISQYAWQYVFYNTCIHTSVFDHASVLCAVFSEILSPHKKAAPKRQTCDWSDDRKIPFKKSVPYDSLENLSV